MRSKPCLHQKYDITVLIAKEVVDSSTLVFGSDGLGVKETYLQFVEVVVVVSVFGSNFLVNGAM